MNDMEKGAVLATQEAMLRVAKAMQALAVTRKAGRAAGFSADEQWVMDRDAVLAQLVDVTIPGGLGLFDALVKMSEGE